MPPSADKFAPVRFCSDDVPERDRIAFVREVYGRAVVKHEIEPNADEPFYWRGIVRALPGAGLASMEVSGMRTQRTARQIDSDDLVLNITLHGDRVVRQFGREAIVGPGELAVTRSADVAACEIKRGSSCLGLRIPLVAIRHMISDLDSLIAKTISNSPGPTALLLSYATYLLNADALVDTDVWNVAIPHVYDLVALTLGATHEAAEIAKGRGLRVARLRAAKADIVENIGRRDLSLDTVAKRQGISPNYLRKLFEGEDNNFTEFVLAQRLARAHRMLSDPRFATHAIGAIAYEAGFGDLSYFNHTFRRYFGLTPSDVRKAARENARD